jgi:hypothetical protein
MSSSIVPFFLVYMRDLHKLHPRCCMSEGVFCSYMSSRVRYHLCVCRHDSMSCLSGGIDMLAAQIREG